MNQKFWFGLCICFSIFNLKLLIDDYYLINYVIVENDDPLFDNITNYLLCTRFGQFQNKNQLDGIDQNVSTEKLLNYLISTIEEYLNITNPFKLNETFIFREQFCFLTQKSNFENDSFLVKFLQNYESYIFLFSNGKKPHYHEYILQASNSDGKVYLRMQKQKVYGQEYLTNSKCFKFENQFERSIFNCLNKCFIQFKHPNGFYSLDDIGGFNIDIL